MVLAVGLAACHHNPPPAPQVLVPIPRIPAESPWVATLEQVKAAAAIGQFATADSILTAFERMAPQAPEVPESVFWRTMLRADPRNPAFSPADARHALEAYVSDPAAERRIEANVMLRMLVLSDSLRTAQVAQRAAADARDKARDDEVQKLRDDLQRTQAELDRIKKRLGSKP